MKWNGMSRKTSPTDDSEGVLHYQENARMETRGELRRRHGMSRSSVEKIATPIYGIASTVAPVASVAIQGSNGSIFGYTGFTPLWGDVVLLPPTGTAVKDPDTYNYVDGDSVSRSIPFSQPASFSVPDNRATYTDAATAINTGGVNGETYRVIFDMNVQMASAILSLTEISLTGTLSAASTISTGGTSNNWLFTGGTSGVQGDQSTATLEKTYAIKGGAGGALPIDLIGATGAYDVDSFNTWLVPGGTTITMEAMTNLQSGLSVAYTITGTLAFTTQLRETVTSDQWVITVNRSEAFDTSFDIVAKDGSYPADASDGTYIGNLPISPGSASANNTFTAPNTNSTWKWAAIPRAGSLVGPMGLLT